MTHRVIEVSSAPARLSIRNRQLMIERQDQENASIPVEDIALLLLNNRGISLSHAVLTELPENKAAIIHCGAGHMPVSLSLPIAGNAVQGERLRYQLACSRPLRKRLWQQIIQAKIRMQGVVLAEFGLPPSGLKAIAGRVRSGDPDNLEAQGLPSATGRCCSAKASRETDMASRRTICSITAMPSSVLPLPAQSVLPVCILASACFIITGPTVSPLLMI